ncbi:MAG: hypothetical protein ACFB50_14585 [Rubrobacteraceae bacterium]
MCKDVKERDPFWFYDVEDEDSGNFTHGDLDYEEDEFGFEEFGCVFGSECCMPGFHFRSECYTPEMAEEWYAAEKQAEKEDPVPEEVSAEE